MKLKSLLEGYAWERKADGSLPTLADAAATHAKNIQEFKDSLNEYSANTEHWIKGYWKQQEGDTGEWKLGQNGDIEIYVDGKLIGSYAGTSGISLPIGNQELVKAFKAGNYGKPMPSNYSNDYDGLNPEDME